MNKIVIFLGPSLPITEARAILDAVYLSPAKQSDLISAVTNYKPDIIGLIDGVFHSYPSVWHKEILYALQQGIAVYGASSMGALRAAETSDFGMVGVGEIYRLYASGELIDDDEVALIHGQEDTGYRPLSEPMVNVRATFCRAQAEGIISNNLSKKLTAIAKSIYFPERTFYLIFRQAKAAGMLRESVEAIESFVKDKYVNIKGQDAILLLETIRDLPKPLPKVKPDFELKHNQFFATLYHRDRTVLRNKTTVPLGDIAGYAALHLPDFEQINLHACNRALVQILADFLEVKATEAEVDQQSQRFRFQHSLTEEEAFADWLVQNDLALEEFKQLMYEMARSNHLRKWLMTQKSYEQNTKMLLDELRLQNRYQESADAAALRENIIQENYPNFSEENNDDLTILKLAIEHQHSTGCRVSLRDDWLKEAGFFTPELLKLELLRSHLARKAIQNRESNSALEK